MAILRTVLALGLCRAVVEATLRGPHHTHKRSSHKGVHDKPLFVKEEVVPTFEKPHSTCSATLPRHAMNAESQADEGGFLDGVYGKREDKAFNISSADRNMVMAAANRVSKVQPIECSEDSYGEITQEAAFQLFTNPLVHLEAGETFADLGSGLGRLVVNAALMGNAKRSIGFELSKTRASEACGALSEVSQALPVAHSSGWREERHEATVELYEGDIMDIEDSSLKSVNVVYVANLCFRQEILNDVAKKLSRALPAGARVASLRKLDATPATSRLKSQGSVALPMSWSFQGYKQAVYVYLVQ